MIYLIIILWLLLGFIGSLICRFDGGGTIPLIIWLISIILGPIVFIIFVGLKLLEIEL